MCVPACYAEFLFYDGKILCKASEMRVWPQTTGSYYCANMEHFCQTRFTAIGSPQLNSEIFFVLLTILLIFIEIITHANETNKLGLYIYYDEGVFRDVDRYLRKHYTDQFF